jgi:hypothetical protein
MAVVTMPEATVNEYGHVKPGQDEIGPARKTLRMQPEPESQTV